MSKHRYKNSFHRPDDQRYGPEYYETSVDPVEFLGCLLFKRGLVYDLVQDGVCICQRVCPRAKQIYDSLLSVKKDEKCQR